MRYEAGLRGKDILRGQEIDAEELTEKLRNLIYEINEMIFKEESILFPMVIDTLTQEKWINIMEESDEIGYCITSPAGN